MAEEKDEGQELETTGTSTEASTVAPAPAPETTAVPDTTPVAASAPTPEPQESWEDIRDFAKKQGLDLSHVQDATEAANYLVQQARNNNAYTQFGQQLAPYYSEFQQFLASRQQQPAQQAAPAQPQKPSFGLPEFDPQWLDWLQRDAAGNVVPKPGAPPDVLGKVVQYQKALANFQDKFWQQPQQYLQPLIQDAVTPLVQQAIQQNLRGYQEQVYATNFLAQNTNWMHYHGANGDIVRDPVTGAYAMTPEGQAFVGHVNRAQQLGIRDIHAQQQYAMDQLKLAYFGQQMAQQQATSQGAQRDQALIQQRNRRAPNSSGSMTTGPAGPSQNPVASLSDRLRNALTTGGVNDAALVADIR